MCLSFFRLFRKKEYQTLNLIEISQKALVNNYSFFQNLHPEAKIAPVLKSNAYGHGLKLMGILSTKKSSPFSSLLTAFTRLTN